MSHSAAAVDLLQWAANRNGRRPESPADLSLAVYLENLEIDSLLYLASDRAAARQRIYDRIWHRQLAVLREILAELDRAGVPALVLKGGELIPAAYAPHAIGLVGDVDLLVRRRDVGTARQILFKHDFRQAVYDAGRGCLQDRDIADIGQIEAVHYELAPFCWLEPIDLPAEAHSFLRARNHQPVFVASDRTLLLIEIDLHHGVATDMDPDPFFERAVPSTHGVGSTLSPADHLWFVMTRLYNEVALHGKRTLRGFAYVLPLLRRPDLDWDVVSRTGAELSLGATLYYYLAFLNWLVGGVPDEVLRGLHPQTTSRVRDWGWQLGKLFEFVEPFPFDAVNAIEAHRG